MKKQKGFVIPLIIAIVAIFAIGGGYYYTQKESVCWPYCKNMTDKDGELIKKSVIDQGVATTSIVDSVKINQKVIINGVKINPLKVTDDSRCPQTSNIQCIWAGTVKLDTEINDKTINLVLGKSISISDYKITLLKVLPIKSSTVILSSDYNFEFSVVKATSTLIGGDKDIHGCLGSAGYSWCEIKNKCLRVWEETCSSTSIVTSKNECKTDFDCKEISCVSGGFAHELCTEGKCTMSDVVKNKCSTSIKASCTPNWQCGWTSCTNGYQAMKAVDSNNCGISLVGFQIACPALARECL